MLYFTIVAVAVIALLVVRLLRMRRELRRVTAQLKSYNEGRSGKKTDLSYYEKDLESLAAEINRLIDRVTESGALQRRTENELKQAIANMSHDIRTPLTSIFGYIQLLEAEDLSSEEKHAYLSVIKHRSQRLQALLNDFFELSVIESTDYELKPARIRFVPVLQDVIMSLYDQFTDCGITPLLDFPEEEIIGLTDESAVKRVIENLLLNTIKHTRGEVGIGLKRQNNEAVLVIRNDAPHLAGTDPSLLFDRFYTADQTRSGKGTGLGLSIARSLMEKMGGRLSAELSGDVLTMTCRWELTIGGISQGTSIT
jgi:signal transduction histidine kinase